MSKIPTLLLTGQNNHDWKRSAPFCQQLLQNSGRFDVTMSTDASAALEDAPGLARYRLIFLDYNGPIWSPAAQANFLAAVNAGAGVVVLHAADNAFPGWVEYERMVALLWREGTGHGEFHQFRVKVADRQHPITRGIADFDQWDELYHRLVHMHGSEFHVLATAFSDPKKGGTGNHEPVAVTTRYGQGRVYHHVLGHIWAGDPQGPYKGATLIAFENPPFQQLLLRGCEWAATGEVTQA